MLSTVNLPQTPASESPVHPLGSRARVLLTSVFGPYAQDDQYGSRLINPMELYHNQVTRTQGPFSLRMFHRSWGLMLIQANISAPCTLLDFPTLDRFLQELRTQPYDVIGIGAIIPNLRKVEAMCQFIRQIQPNATIVVGGHVANAPRAATRLELDHLVRGDGVRWMRRFLGDDENAPVHHPRILSGIGARTLGITLRNKPGDVAATLIPSVGCPMGCNFCATSAMFGGKGKFINFYDEGSQLFDIMAQLEQDMSVHSFFVMDENFLLHRKRALQLLELMQKHQKPWSIYVFSSANVLKSYTIEQLVGLGVSWVWMGLEGKDSRYAKLSRADTVSLVKHLQSHGIHVLGSSIIGLEEHGPDNIDDAIAYSVSHATDFHQFMLYTPIPGTALYREHEQLGTLLDPEGNQLHDAHGQLRFNYVHPRIPPGEETDYLRRAFEEDFRVNGPSVLRLAGTILQGWRRYRDHSEKRIRERYAKAAADLPTLYAGALWATRRWLRDNKLVIGKIDYLLQQIHQEWGIKSRLLAPIAGSFIHHKLKREARRLAGGWTYEPPTFYEKNAAAAALAV